MISLETLLKLLSVQVLSFFTARAFCFLIFGNFDGIITGLAGVSKYGSKLIKGLNAGICASAFARILFVKSIHKEKNSQSRIKAK